MELTPENLGLILTFIVPGFVSIKTYGLFISQDRSKLSDLHTFMEAITFSSINLAILFWLVLLINGSVNGKPFIEIHPVVYIISMIFILLIGPVLWPTVFAYFRRTKNSSLNKFILSPYELAWDYYFADGPDCWVLIHLNDDTMIGGRFCAKSYASGFPNPNDIYLEEVWKVNEFGEFIEKVENTKGLYINNLQYKYLEFFSGSDYNNNESNPEMEV